MYSSSHPGLIMKSAVNTKYTLVGFRKCTRTIWPVRITGYSLARLIASSFIQMPLVSSKCVPWPDSLPYDKQSVLVPGTKRPGQTGEYKFS